MSMGWLKASEDFAGRLGLALLGGVGILVAVLALMVVAYLSEPKHRPFPGVGRGGVPEAVSGRW